MVGKEYSTEELVRIILEDIKFYKRSGGGVTFTGGEPTGQISFLNSLVLSMVELNINTCIETCGYFDFDKCKDTLYRIDTILFDLKLISDNLSKKYTGANSGLIFENLERLNNECTNEIIIRIPLIPEITMTDENLYKINEFLLSNSIQRIKEVNLLPYHKLGIKKYKLLDKDYKLKKTKLSSQYEINHVVKIFDKFKVRIV
jgi:pyruvate formate lyase activating enzyme